MREGEQSLAARLQRAETLTADIERQLSAGEESAGAAHPHRQRRRPPSEPAAAPDAKSVAAAAQAFAERANARLRGLAA